MSIDELRWGNQALSLTLRWGADLAPRLVAVRVDGVDLDLAPGRPMLEVVTVGSGHALANDRLVETTIGQRSRYVGHRDVAVPGGRELLVEVTDPGTGLNAELSLMLADDVPALRCSVRLRNDSTVPVALRSVVSFAALLGRPAGSLARPGIGCWTLLRGLSDWLAEGRWAQEPADPTRFPSLAQELTGHNPRSAFTAVSTGTWSTGTTLPFAALVSAELGAAWAWQIEHNGAWRWEVGADTADGYLALSGPTDVDHQWLKVLAAGEEFTSVPVAVTVAPDFTRAVAHLTGYRRAHRRAHADNTGMKVVFNDYMNTLNGDPTTDRLLPLIDAAADVGAEVFCIDAGWYDNGNDWWDSVGEWQPSQTRFPGGLSQVIGHIRQRGMVPGLWLEPEVVGVRSPVADLLPGEAFLQRAGQRLVEQDRYHLDLRHPSARAHLDAVVDRLVADLGVGFFKLDYNINPGPGTDLAADSVGDGLLGHNRAHLAWLDGVLERHPQLILENCGSGAMRADFALLSRLQLQSTSDQQDPLKYPPIAAGAPAAMLPEQAASWAYPQPGMSSEQVAFTLATGLVGRIYLSGYLNKMDPAQLALVAEALRLAKALRAGLTAAVPGWPLGLPGWDDPQVALGLVGSDQVHLTVWDRAGTGDGIELDLTDLPAAGFALGPGEDLKVEQVFPATLAPWTTTWDADRRRLTLHNPTGEAGARIFGIYASANSGPRPTSSTTSTGDVCRPTQGESQ